MSNETESKLPLGILRQACMKLDSFISDMAEAGEDPDIDADIRDSFVRIREMASLMQAQIINTVVSEGGEEEDFLNESFDMDKIDEWGHTSYGEGFDDEEDPVDPNDILI